jgi:lysophospholipase L1-like esterase
MSPLAIALVLFGFLATPGASPKAQRYLALGDSYTIGQGVEEPDRWPNLLVSLLREKGTSFASPEIIARTGWTVRDLSEAIDVSQPRGPYDLVTLLIGVNDQYQGEQRGGDPESYRQSFAALLRRAIGFAGGQAGHVVVLSIPDWSVTPFAERSGRDRARTAAEIERFNQINREETAKAGARYVDVTPVSREARADRSLLAPDGLHPSGSMYAAWARLALPQALEAIGASPRSGSTSGNLHPARDPQAR